MKVNLYNYSKCVELGIKINEGNGQYLMELYCNLMTFSFGFSAESRKPGSEQCDVV